MLPLATPLLIAGIQSGAQMLASQPFAAVGRWLRLIGAFGVVSLVVGWLAFQYVLEE